MTMPALARGVAALATTLGLGSGLAADRLPPTTDGRPDPALARVFWDCDARASHTWMSGADGATCAAVLDRVKQQAFGGDFARFLAWWRAHRRAAYAERGLPVPGDDAPARAAPPSSAAR